MLLDVFNADCFSMTSLTTAINKLPFAPSRIGSMGIFQFKGHNLLHVMVEEKQGTLRLIPTQARGSHANVMGGDRRKARAFSIPHVPLDSAVFADDVQGIRAFGSEDQIEGVAQVVNDKLAMMRQAHEVTHEYMRIGAVKGQVLDADGSTVIYDWFDEFGLTQDVVNFDLESTDEETKIVALSVKRLIEEALGGSTYTGIQCMCGNDFFDALVTNPKLKESYDRFQESIFWRTQQVGQYGVGGGFEWGGVFWENYRGKVGDVDFIASDEAHFFPLGVFGLFQEVFGPADFVETVNTPGLRVYAKQERMKFDKGVELHTQSNPLMICSRPKVLVKGTMGAGSGS